MFWTKNKQKQRNLQWYYIEKRQLAVRIRGTSIPSGQYAIISSHMEPWGSSPDILPQVTETFAAALKIMKDCVDDDIQFYVVDSQLQIICWANGGHTPELVDIDAVLGMKPDNAEELDKIMDNAKARE